MEEYDFQLYENIEDVKYYSLFIRPDGKMHRVWKFDHPPYSDEYYVTHTEWASSYINATEILKQEYEQYQKEHGSMSCIDYLCSQLHYIGYTRVPDYQNANKGYFILFPFLNRDSNLYHYHCTEEQIEVLKRLQQMNQDTPSKDFLACMDNEKIASDIMQEVLDEITINQNEITRR